MTIACKRGHTLPMVAPWWSLLAVIPAVQDCQRHGDPKGEDRKRNPGSSHWSIRQSRSPNLGPMASIAE
jgi:hypothetical protein